MEKSPADAGTLDGVDVELSGGQTERKVGKCGVGTYPVPHTNATKFNHG